MKKTVMAIAEEQKWATVAAATLCIMDAVVWRSIHPIHWRTDGGVARGVWNPPVARARIGECGNTLGIVTFMLA